MQQADISQANILFKTVESLQSFVLKRNPHERSLTSFFIYMYAPAIAN